jgi:hypothetical protein
MKISEKELKAINETINEKFDGDKNSFLKDYRNKILLVLFSMGTCFVYSMLIIINGFLPIITLIFGTILLLLSIPLIKYYNALFKKLN